MKNLIVYSSNGGNTEKLAHAVAETLAGDNTLAPLDKAPDPEGFDLVAVGFWFKAGGPDPKAASFLPGLSRSRVFLFATHGARADSDHAAKGMARAAELAGGAKLLGSFNCPGEVKSEVMAKLEKKDPRPPWLDDAKQAVGRPNESDLASLEAALKKAGLA